MMPGLVVRPGPVTGLGAVVETTSLERLDSNDFETLREALYRYNVICIKRQTGFTSRS